MWTEITKDLVSLEAIKEKGYEYEETEKYYYVMEYLRYVCLQLPTTLSLALVMHKPLPPFPSILLKSKPLLYGHTDAPSRKTCSASSN